MTIGFARDWLAWHDQQKTVREAGFRRWEFIASALVFLAAIGLALKGVAQVVIASAQGHATISSPILSVRHAAEALGGIVGSGLGN